MGVPRAAIGRLLRAMVFRAKRLLVGPVGVGLVALTSFVAPLSAQSARDREGLAAFVDSLAAASDNEAIRAIERGLMARARRDRANPGLHIRLGLIALRLGEYSGAASELKWTTQLAPQWGAAWLGWARAELGLGEGADTSRIGRRAFLARDAFDRASQAVARAITVDSGLSGAVEQLARDRVAAAKPASADVIRQGLRRAVVGRARHASNFLALGRVEALLGDTTAALIAFESAAAAPRGRGLGLLEAARLRLVRSEYDRGSAAFFEAATIDDSAVVAGLRADLAWIATGAELEAFDARTGVDRARFVRQFWARRDRADLRPDGHRLTTHYARLAATKRAFSNRDDQRVAVWIRHGEPDARATLRAAEVRPNESWRYRRPDGDLLVHFLAGPDTSNYRVVESVFDVIEGAPGAPAADGEGAAGGLLDQVLRSRAQLSPFYQSAVAGRRDQLAAFRIRERELGQASRNLALTTDGDPLRFFRDLPARLQVVSIDGRADSGAVRVFLVIPAFAIDSATPKDSAGLARIRIVAWDTARGVSAAIDTTVTLTPVEGTGPGGFRAQVALPVAAGRYDSRVAIEVGQWGLIVGRDAILVGVEEGPRLSDLTVGAVRAGHRWVLGPDDSVAASPGLVFDRTDSLVIGAALIGFDPGEAVRFRVWSRPFRTDGKDEKWKVWSGADWRPVGGSGAVRRAVVVVSGRGLKAGRYEVELEAASAGGRSVRTRARIAVVDPEK